MGEYLYLQRQNAGLIASRNFSKKGGDFSLFGEFGKCVPLSGLFHFANTQKTELINQQINIHLNII